MYTYDTDRRINGRRNISQDRRLLALKSPYGGVEIAVWWRWNRRLVALKSPIGDGLKAISVHVSYQPDRTCFNVSAQHFRKLLFSLPHCVYATLVSWYFEIEESTCRNEWSFDKSNS